MMSESTAEMRRLESWPNNKPAISPSAFAWVKICLGRMPLVGLGVGLTLLELVLIGLFLGIHAGFIFYSYRRSDTEHFAKSLGEVVHWYPGHPAFSLHRRFLIALRACVRVRVRCACAVVCDSSGIWRCRCCL